MRGPPLERLTAILDACIDQMVAYDRDIALTVSAHTPITASLVLPFATSRRVRISSQMVSVDRSRVWLHCAL